MTCERMLPRVGAYVDGELPASEREDIEAHLEECQGCKEAAEGFQWLDRVTGHEVVQSVSSAEWASVWEGVVQTKKGVEAETRADAIPTQQRFKRVPMAALALAALAIIGLCVGWAIVGSWEGSDTSSPVAKGPVGTAGDETTKDLDVNSPEEIRDGKLGIAEFIQGEKPEIREDDLYYEDF